MGLTVQGAVHVAFARRLISLLMTPRPVAREVGPGRYDQLPASTQAIIWPMERLRLRPGFNLGLERGV